jgi:hypothetical protein
MKVLLLGNSAPEEIFENHLIVALNKILLHFMNHLSVNGLEGQEFDSMCRTTQPNFMNFIFFLQQLQLNNFD